MRVYFDSSVLVRLYVQETGSDATHDFFDQYQHPVNINALQEFEIRNSVRQKVVRMEIAEGVAVAALRAFDDDVVCRRVLRTPLEWAEIYEEGENLSRRWAIRHVCRAIDLLHVAIAIASDVRDFATADKDQGDFARAAGLKVVRF